MASDVIVRPVKAGEGPLLRELRLRALSDSPEAFTSSLHAERDYPDTHWDQLAAASGRGEEILVLAALRDQRSIGMAAARWFDGPAGIVQLWGMWVELRARGQRLGSVLVEAIAGWAAARGANAVRIGVTEPARGVAAFYEGLGFERTGETKLLPGEHAIKAFFLIRRP